MKTEFSKEIEKQLLEEHLVDVYFDNGKTTAFFNYGEKLENGDWDLFGVVLTEGGTLSCGTRLSQLEEKGFVYDESKNVYLNEYQY